MLTRQELAHVEQALRGQKVLSVYLDRTSAGPPVRPPWRDELERLVARQRDALRTAPRDERETFEACVDRLHARMTDYAGVVGAPGWIGLFPSHGDAHVEALPMRTPTLLTWADGARIAPYLRALPQHRPAIVVTADSRAATIRVYVRGTLEIVEQLQVAPEEDHQPHMGYPPRAGFHTGTRGGTGADDEDRERRAAFERMRRELVRQVEVLAGGHAWVFVGGIAPIVAGIIDALPERLHTRARRLTGIDVHSGEARIRGATEQAASEASRELDLERVDALLDTSAAGGQGVAGTRATVAALRACAAECLFVSSAFVERHPARAESLARLAFDQAADVAVVAGAAAERLDAAGGVGATLRFLPARHEAPLVGAEGAGA